jgi:hypothetical protein
MQRVARGTVARSETSLQLNVAMSDTVTPRLGCAHFHNDDRDEKCGLASGRAKTARSPRCLTTWIDGDTERIWLIK